MWVLYPFEFFNGVNEKSDAKCLAEVFAPLFLKVDIYNDNETRNLVQ